MKFYITGIAGQLGYGIYRQLREKAEIAGMDVVDITLKNAAFMKCSLFDWELVKEHILEEKPNVLIHTAANVNVDGCEENPRLAEELNTEVTKKLADLCAASGIKMIYISTDAVFDGRNEQLYTEEDPVNPINVYGKTKLEGEYAVLKHPEHLVLRTNIYGINVQNKQSFGEWIYYSLKAGKELNMFTDIDFSPIFIPELADIIYMCYTTKLCGVYHACGTGAVSKYEFGVKLKEIFEIATGEIHKSVSDDFDFKAERAKHMGMSNEKLRKSLGISISTPYESIEKFRDAMEKEGKLL